MRNSYLKYFIIIGVVFSLASITLYCAKKIESDRALSLLPKESFFLFSADMKRLSTTDLYNKIKENPEGLEKYNEFIQKTGIDPEKHLERVVFSIPPDVAESQEVAIAIFGTFDQEKILSSIREEGEVETSTYEGLEIYTFTQEEGEPMSMSFLAEGCLAIGKSETVRKMVELSKGKGESLEKNAEMMEILKDANQEDMFWGAGLLPEDFRQKAMENPMTQSFASLRSVILSLNAEKGLDFYLLGKSDKEEDAKLLADTIKGLIALGKMGAGEKPYLIEVLDSIAVDAEETAVSISMHLSEELVERLGKEAESQLGEQLKEK